MIVRRQIFFLLAFSCAAALPGIGVWAQPSVTSSDLELFAWLANRQQAARDRAAEILAERGDPSAAAAFIEALRFVPQGESWHRAMRLLTGERFGDDWNAWMEWLGVQPLPLHPDYLAFKLAILERIDPSFGRFFPASDSLRIRPERIVWGGVRVDGIPALTHPRLVEGAGAAYLDENEPVFGVMVNGTARAYPLRIVDWHEMVNDTVGGHPVALVYCTLCGSAILFDAVAGGRVRTFGSSGLLYESNKLMFDRETSSLWSAMLGTPVAGPLTDSGLTLAVLPVVRASWRAWRTLHPATTVLSLETGHKRDYSPDAAYGNYTSSEHTMFPVSRRDDRLEPKSWVYGVVINGTAHAYPVEELPEDRALNDSTGGIATVVLADGDHLSVRVYRREEISFGVRQGVSKVLDSGGGTWTVMEDGLVDAVSGRRLARVPGHLSYWFGWFSFYPATTIWEE